MSEPQDERVELSELTRSIFERAREGDPSPEAIEGLRRALASKLGSTSGSGSQASPGHTAKLGWALGGAASVIVIASVVALRVADHGALATATHRESSNEPTDSIGSSISHTESSTETDESISNAPMLPPVDIVDAPTRHRPALDEAEYIESVRRVIEVNPLRALRLTRAHSSRFSAPTLTEEAQALQVEALARLGRESDALRSAHVFFARYPDTPYRRRIERVLDPSSRAEGR